jgi:hypothetical protein
VVFACAQPVVFAGSDARPYALLLLVIAGSTLALVRWLENANMRHAAVYAITAAMIPHLHYLASPVLGSMRCMRMRVVAKAPLCAPAPWFLPAPQLCF